MASLQVTAWKLVFELQNKQQLCYSQAYGDTELKSIWSKRLAVLLSHGN
jgi:hypothetical protein